MALSLLEERSREVRIRRGLASSACVTIFLSIVVCVGYYDGARAEGSASQTHHALMGELEKVDAEAKKITVRSADGTEHTFSYTGF